MKLSFLTKVGNMGFGKMDSAIQISKCLFRVLLSLAQMQNLGPIYKTKNVYSLMFMLVIIHRAYVLKLFLDSSVHLIIIFLIKIARKITAFNKICTHHQYFFLNKK
jgi:hypothetical protein